MSKRTLLAAAGLGVLLAGTCAVSGVSLVPVGVTLGPCLKDWTSPSSYSVRASPLATVEARVGGANLKLCYGRPSARGRVVFGNLVPYDEAWRLGANEPTRLYVNRAIDLGGVRLEPGRYSLYAEPSQGSWKFFVNRSVLHWGNDLSPAVRAREVARVTVPVDSLTGPVETLTVRAEPMAGDAVRLAFEWERTRAALEVRPAAPLTSERP